MWSYISMGNELTLVILEFQMFLVDVSYWRAWKFALYIILKYPEIITLVMQLIILFIVFACNTKSF